MPKEDKPTESFKREDHQAAYIFDPEDDDDEHGRTQRPAKKRRVSKQSKAVNGEASDTSMFVPLLNGAEKNEYLRLREQLFAESWAKIDVRIQNALREANSATLEQVTSFVSEAQASSNDRIPCSFIATGTNIDSQNLLFEQLSESLQTSSRARFVRLRSADATSLKGTLKRVIRDVTDKSSGDDEDDLGMINGQDVRRAFLDYDLEALHAFVRAQQTEHVFVAFEDSEGFDSALLSDLIPLFNSWRPRIPFTLLFGIATSVELLQSRLLKSACQKIYGAQFDAAQSHAILETVFKIAVAAEDVPVRIGGTLLHGMLDRQHEQVAGIQAFISSLKYAYMCHFYANALSPLLYATDRGLPKFQPEHIDAMRNTGSYQVHLEREVDEAEEAGEEDLAGFFKRLESTVLEEAQPGVVGRRRWVSSALRTLLVLEAAGALNGDFPSSYADAMAGGIRVSEESTLAERVRRMDDKTLMGLLVRVTKIYGEGDSSLNLGPTVEPEHGQLQTGLQDLTTELGLLQEAAEEKGVTLRSKFGGQNKIMRTTVIAQRVQLSKDSAALSEEDKKFTRVIQDTVKLLAANIAVQPPQEVLFSECWIYDSKSPSRDVLIPRPLVVFERCLTRPQDYLGCECCQHGGGEDDEAAVQQSGLRATMPATSILYQLYLETGNLINVADLWTAFHGVVSQDERDERKVLVLFYRALAELRALGFVKASKKKADHVAKLKWL